MRRYGAQAATGILESWKQFSKAFVEFPYGTAVYTIPTQHGPANPLRISPTGYKAGMMLFPYDDFKTWAGPYPAQIVEKQFRRVSEMWLPGLEHFRNSLVKVPIAKQAGARKDLAIAETCYLHFRSTANQFRFFRRLPLEVNASERTAKTVPGYVALGDNGGEAVRQKLLPAETAGEKTARIFVQLHFDQEGSRDRKLSKNHQNTSSSGMGTTKRPPHSRMCAICRDTSSRKFHGRIRT